ncbi:hypothetical protein DL98DRAFT_636594 [Cadophora sp. DSE1049]|nr:hypothetical protein DL98DRAFT_636594 [Cadophora sp. DSE1049]
MRLVSITAETSTSALGPNSGILETSTTSQRATRSLQVYSRRRGPQPKSAVLKIRYQSEYFGDRIEASRLENMSSTMVAFTKRPISPGYYTRVYADGTVGERRTVLLDHTEEVLSLPEKQRANFMEYFKKSVLCKHRFVLPIPRHILKNDSMFILFPKLCAELRTMVWKAALPGPRILEVFYYGSGLGSLDRPSDARHSQRSLPNIPASCKEAHNVVSKNYDRVRLFSLGHEPVEASWYMASDSWHLTPQKYLVSWEKDVFYFPAGLSGDLSDIREGSQIRNLALEIHHHYRYRTKPTLKDFGLNQLHVFKNLRNIIFAADCERHLARRVSRYAHFGNEYLERKDALPIETIPLDDEPDHPFFVQEASKVSKLQDFLAQPEVVETFKKANVKAGFEIWRRDKHMRPYSPFEAINRRYYL